MQPHIAVFLSTQFAH